jgi:type I restriction enzyme S subunit
MRSNVLLENLGIFAHTSDGIRLLRQSILRNAISGRLVDQGSEEGTGYELVAKILGNRGIEAGLQNQPNSDMPKNWGRAKLGEIFYLEMGQSPNSDSYNSRKDGLPFYQGKTDFGTFVPTPRVWCSKPNKVAEAGDVLLSVRAPVGPTNYASEKCCIGRGLAAVRPLGGMQTEFTLWWLRAYETQIAEMGTGTTFVAVSKKNLEPFMISVPPLAEQKRILDKINELMKLCDELEARILLQNRLSTAARNSAVAAISTAQTQEEMQIAWERIQSNWEVLTGTSDSVESIRLLVHDLATRGVLSGEEIFEVVELKDIAQINYGYTESAKRTEVGPKFLRITDIQLGKVDWDTVPYCPISSAEEEKHLLKDGDLVFARTGATTGKSFLLNNPPRSVCASYLIRVRPDVKKVLPEYLYLYFQSGQYWVDVKSGMSGTAQGGFNSSKLGALAIRIPDLATQAKIIKKTNELLQVCEDLGRSLLRQQILAEKFARSVVSISA